MRAVLPDIKHVMDVTSRGPLPRLLAPYVALYGPLHVYADDVTGHLFVRAGNGGEVAGAEHYITLRPVSKGLKKGSRIYAGAEQQKEARPC